VPRFVGSSVESFGKPLMILVLTALGAGCDSTRSVRPVITLFSGLQYRDVVPGTGAVALPGKILSVHYVLRLEDGTKVDSSVDRGQPFEFVLGQGGVIKGWEEGIPGMRVGGTRWLKIPPELGYGALGTPGGPIPPNATLICNVTLLEVRDSSAH